MLPVSGVSIKNIGWKWIDLDAPSLSNWIIYPTIGIYFLFLLYNIYLIVIFRSNEEIRVIAFSGLAEI